MVYDSDGNLKGAAKPTVEQLLQRLEKHPPMTEAAVRRIAREECQQVLRDALRRAQRALPESTP